MRTPHLSAVLLALLTHLSAPAFAQTSTNEAAAGETVKEGEGAPDKKDVSVTAASAVEPAREPALPEPEETPAYTPVTTPSGPSWPLQKTIGVAAMALGGASIATGIAMGVVAGFKYADLASRGCTERACPEAIVSSGDLTSARTFVSVSAGTLIGGVVAWAGGILLLATSPQPSTLGARVTPVLGLHQIGVNIKF